MIQRIQTIYLLLASVAGFSMTKLAVYNSILVGDVKGDFLATECWYMFATSMLAAVLATISIFLFKNRKLQKRITIFALLASLGTIAEVVLMFDHYKASLTGVVKVSYSWGALLPIIMVIFLFLAFINIRRDEKLIKSLDRLR